jgi:hypothetical protein
LKDEDRRFDPVDGVAFAKEEFGGTGDKSYFV